MRAARVRSNARKPGANSTIALTPGSRQPVTLRSVGQALWTPRPISKPELDPGYLDLPFLPRVAETLRYQCAKAEYALSPCGRLRAWLKFNARIALVLGIPVALVGPVLIGIAAVLASVSALLLATAINILQLVGVVLLIVAILTALAGAAAHRRKNFRRFP